MKELGEKARVLVGLDLPLAGGGTEAQWGSWVREERFKAESEKADLYQPKWNKNQTVQASTIHTLGRNAGLLEEAMAGSWS